MYREAEHYLTALEVGLGMKSPEIIQGMWRHGWPMSEPTLTRLRTRSDVNIDVAGLPFYTIGKLFPFPVARMAQISTWMNRRAVFEGLTGDKLDDALSASEQQLRDAEEHYAQLKPPISDDERAFRRVDLGSIEEAKGQLASTRGLHLKALSHFLEAYKWLLPVARGGFDVGAIIACSRTLAAALNEAFDCDEAEKRRIGEEPIGMDWSLWKVIQLYRDPSPLPILEIAMDFTGDDRMAANHADGFQLAGKPSQSAQMMRIGLRNASEGSTIETWQPHGRSAPVISEGYMKSAVTAYKQLLQKEGHKAAAKKVKGDKSMKRAVITAIGIIALIAAITSTIQIHSAEARPGRVTTLVVPLNLA